MLAEGKCHKSGRRERKSFVIPIFKGKRDVQKYGNYRSIKLVSHSIKICKKIINKK